MTEKKITPPIFDAHHVDERAFSHCVGVDFSNGGATISLAMLRTPTGTSTDFGLYIVDRLFTTEEMFVNFVNYLIDVKQRRSNTIAAIAQHHRVPLIPD